MKIFTKYYFVWVAVGLALSLTITASAQYRVLHHFTSGVNDGSTPLGSLIQSGSTLYGMTMNGGSSNIGSIFKIDEDGTEFQLIHSFISPTDDGQQPYGALLLSDSIFYGMAASEQTSFCGTLFRMNIDGTDFHVLHAFIGGSNDGKCPYDTPILSGSTLYGMTANGGGYNNGTIFKINIDGTGFELLHSFGGGINDGGHSTGNLIQSGSSLFGITFAGGASDLGTIFKINIDGTGFSLLHTFTGGANDGRKTHGSLIQSGSILYGMTTEGGSSSGIGGGTVFKINSDGSGFQLLHRFNVGSGDGLNPIAGNLVIANSTLYGMTQGGGASGNGVIFQMNTDGTGFQVLHSFGGSDGKFPYGALFLSDTTLYGMTSEGGSQNLGVIFALDLSKTTSVYEKRKTGSIDGFQLHQNYPNPFNPTTVISYRLSTYSNVKLTIYNALGQKIKSFVTSFQSAGEHSVVWDATDDANKPVCSGIYFCGIETNNRTFQKKMVRTR